MSMERNIHNRLRGATILENASEPSSSADEQRDGCRGSQTVIRKLQDSFPRETTHLAQGDEAHDHGNQKCDVSAANEMQYRIHYTLGRSKDIGPAVDQDQHHRQLDR